MTYYQTKFSLTKNQLQKIANAVQDNTEITLRLSKANFNQQGYNLPLTHTQINKLNDGNVHDLNFFSAQMKYINNKIKKHPDVKNGGFLPLAALAAKTVATNCSYCFRGIRFYCRNHCIISSKKSG